MSVCVIEADFDVGAEISALAAGRGDVGGIVTFVGLVRGGESEQGIAALTLEHYPQMTEKALADIVGMAQTRWQLIDVRIIHRIGRLLPGERIVFVGVAARHRADAFAACEFIMDYLKTRAPFWKKEDTPDGGRWVEANSRDEDAAARWEEVESRR